MLSTFPFVIREWHCFAISINLDPGNRLTLVSCKMLAVLWVGLNA